MQHAAERVHHVESLGLAGDRALDLRPAGARREVDRPHLEQRVLLPGQQQPLAVERGAGDAGRWHGAGSRCMGDSAYGYEGGRDGVAALQLLRRVSETPSAA